MNGDRGGAAVTVLMACSVVLIAAVVALMGVVDIGIASARARTAADAAALAAAGSSALVGGDGDACGAARRAARANGADLLSCRVRASAAAGSLEGTGVEVEVAVAPRSPLVRPAVARLRARAAAAVG